MADLAYDQALQEALEGDNVLDKLYRTNKNYWKEKTEMTEEKLNLEFYVAGVKFRKDWKKNLEVLEEGDDLCLAREPENRFDPFAVQIVDYNNDEPDGVMLGYVPTKTGKAKIISAALKEGRILAATVVEVSPDFEPWTALKVSIVDYEEEEEVTEDA